jgi:hypothetical protein
LGAGGRKQMKASIVAAAACLLAGCVTQAPALYSWGSYEDLVYASYLSPQDLPAEKQVEVLEKDYQVARSSNRRMPPGWHAHLATLYFQLGKTDQARQELLTEKAEFPESAVFVDRLVANLKKHS